MRKKAFVFLATATVYGCHPVTTPTPDALNSYRGVSTDNKKFIAAWDDLNTAAVFCRKVHNNYESRSKNAEEAKLAIGATGGIFGFAGAMLVAAGTGGAAGGIFAGLAGVASTVLGTAETGPLGTAGFVAQKESIASMVQKASAEAEALPVDQHAKIYGIANGLRNSCFAAEKPETKI